METARVLPPIRNGALVVMVAVLGVLSLLACIYLLMRHRQPRHHDLLPRDAPKEAYTDSDVWIEDSEVAQEDKGATTSPERAQPNIVSVASADGDGLGAVAIALPMVRQRVVKGQLPRPAKVPSWLEEKARDVRFEGGGDSKVKPRGSPSQGTDSKATLPNVQEQTVPDLRARIARDRLVLLNRAPQALVMPSANHTGVDPFAVAQVERSSNSTRWPHVQSSLQLDADGAWHATRDAQWTLQTAASATLTAAGDAHFDGRGPMADASDEIFGRSTDLAKELATRLGPH